MKISKEREKFWMNGRAKNPPHGIVGSARGADKKMKGSSVPVGIVDALNQRVTISLKPDVVRLFSSSERRPDER